MAVKKDMKTRGSSWCRDFAEGEGNSKTDPNFGLLNEGKRGKEGLGVEVPRKRATKLRGFYSLGTWERENEESGKNPEVGKRKEGKIESWGTGWRRREIFRQKRNSEPAEIIFRPEGKRKDKCRK